MNEYARWKKEGATDWDGAETLSKETRETFRISLN
jgi:hypothetical protein